MSIFKFFGKFFKKLGLIFQSITKGAEKVWNATEPYLQEIMKECSSFVNIVNQNLLNPSDEVLKKIIAEFPQYADKVKDLADKFAKDLSTGEKLVDPDIHVTLGNIQAKLRLLKETDPTEWAKASESAANALTIFLDPKKTAWNKIGTIMWFVYQRFIKKN